MNGEWTIVCFEYINRREQEDAEVFAEGWQRRGTVLIDARGNRATPHPAQRPLATANNFRVRAIETLLG